MYVLHSHGSFVVCQDLYCLQAPRHLILSAAPHTHLFVLAMQVRGLPLFSWSLSGLMLIPTAARARTCLANGHSGSSIATVVFVDVPDTGNNARASRSRSRSTSKAVANLAKSATGGAGTSTSAELRSMRARAILTNLAGTFTRVPNRVVHGAALFHRRPANTPAAAVAATAAATTEPKAWVPRVDDRVRMKVSSAAAELGGFSSSRMSFGAGEMVLFFSDYRPLNSFLLQSFSCLLFQVHLSS